MSRRSGRQKAKIAVVGQQPLSLREERLYQA